MLREWGWCAESEKENVDPFAQHRFNGLNRNPSTPSHSECTPNKIGLAQEMQLHFDVYTTKKSRKRMRKTLSEWSENVQEERFRSALESLMRDKCPDVGFVAEGSSGVAITDFQDAMERLMKVPFWKEKLKFDESSRFTNLLFRISADGTQLGEMFAHSLEVVGVSLLNLPVELRQNVYFYLALATVPMTESKSTMERFLSDLYNSIDGCKSLTDGDGVVRETHFVDVDDYACECYKLHHMAQSCCFFCTECTQQVRNPKPRLISTVTHALIIHSA